MTVRLSTILKECKWMSHNGKVKGFNRERDKELAMSSTHIESDVVEVTNRRVEVGWVTIKI